jgi:Ca2+-binding RTX toxin-like protein
MSLLIRLDDMDDFAHLVGWYPDAVVSSGDGSDTLISGSSGDFLIGEAGDDTLLGRAGPDYLQGGTGDDLIDGGSADDIADYSERTVGVRVDLDGVANDGEPQEADDLRAIESVRGGQGEDVLIGNASNNWLEGEGGWGHHPRSRRL